jgi:hypothetical protein
MAMTTEQLVSELKQALGSNLRSIVLYGSAATGDYAPGSSDYDILLVADRLDAGELDALTPVANRWQAAGNPAPQLFTPAELAASADVFPIELLDIQASCRVLLGEDPLTDIKIDMAHFRLQLERELKSRLHLVRQQYLDCAGRANLIAELLTTSVSTFLVLFRAALRLYDEPGPLRKAAALQALTKHVKFHPQPILDVLALKQYPRRLSKSDAVILFDNYLASITSIVETVDRHLHESPT